MPMIPIDDDQASVMNGDDDSSDTSDENHRWRWPDFAVLHVAFNSATVAAITADDIMT